MRNRKLWFNTGNAPDKDPSELIITEIRFVKNQFPVTFSVVVTFQRLMILTVILSFMWLFYTVLDAVKALWAKKEFSPECRTKSQYEDK